MKTTMDDYRDLHRGARAWVIGNGPSLASLDLSVLRDELTLTCNRGHLLFPRLGGPSTYWLVEDPLDWQQFRSEWAAMTRPVKIVADDLEPDDIGACVRVPFRRERFDVSGIPPTFGLRPPFYWGATVTYLMLQWAHFVGAEEIILLGQDFRYSAPDTERVWTIGAIDPDHFDPAYWPPGSKAFRPDMPLMRRAFVAARQRCDEIGVRILNATAGSALDVFDSVDYETLVGRTACLQTAETI